jgi:hypothetical protein
MKTRASEGYKVNFVAIEYSIFIRHLLQYDKFYTDTRQGTRASNGLCPIQGRALTGARIKGLFAFVFIISVLPLPE